ncbi:hypothetical protein O0I10_009301 [Lichtheimia ornata]|uniref:Transmembrane protein 199 n=1 Tax=Lichtheimia ornata TaxID=688661 RepID=A0AAD7UY82_9FUNG|nr:uncharacterized protein O0I10_009301 [Lichtheimia ornata]KAJ8655094.1 hypothetical protein O0I10_009301 [Lichtheimia ornata]
MQLILTKSIQDALDTALVDQPGFSAACQREAETAVKASLNEDYGISLTLLRELATFLGKKHPGRVWFHELVRGSGVYIEPKPEEDPEVKEAREVFLDRLRQEQQNREYAAMVSSVVGSENERFAFGLHANELKQVQGHIVTILNIGLSVAAVFTAVYMGSRTMTDDVGIRVLLSLAGALIIAIVETVLYIGYAQRVLAPPKKSKSIK